MTQQIKKTAGELARKMNTPCLQGSHKVQDARDLMEAHEVDMIGVACKDKFVGTFSRKDFKNAVLRQNLKPSETILYEVMRVDPPFITEDLSITEACNAMLADHWEYMPVLSGQKFVGIISLNDLSIIRDLMDTYKHTEFEKDAVVTYIQSGESYAIASYDAGEQKDA